MTRPSSPPPEPALLRDGAVVDLQATMSDDLGRLTSFYRRAAVAAWPARYGEWPGAEAMAGWALETGVVGVIASVAGDVVAHGCVAASGPERGQLVLTVRPDWRHRGLASDLLEPLLLAAAGSGLNTVTTTMPATELELFHVLQDAGLEMSLRTAAGLVEIDLPVSLDPDTIDRFAGRHRRAAVAGLDHILRPHSIAVIGGSDERGSVGGELVRAIRAAHFGGAVHVVRRRGGPVDGIQSVTSPGELPPGVDLAVIAVPALGVVEAARACAEAGVRGLVVVSAGFGERGPSGLAQQHALVDVCRRFGVRLVGPNSLGVVNTDPAVCLHATFAPQRVARGRIAMASQSGAVGIVAMDVTARRGIGLSSFVSLGNRADVSSNDLLRYWRDDPRTTVIALYLETLGNPRAFAAVAREVSSVKPIVLVKSGRSRAGRRAAASHTGALVEASDSLTDELLRDAGVIRVDTVGELIDVASVLSTSGRPRGRRLAVVTNGGGAGVACADAAEAAGLILPSLSAATRDAIAASRPQASLDNPIDLVADATPEDFVAAVRVVAADPSVDVVVAIHVPPLAGRDDDTPARLADAAATLSVPLVLVPLAQDVESGIATKVAVLPGAEEAARVLGHIAPWVERLAAPPDPPVRQAGTDRLRAARAVAIGLSRGEDWLEPELAGEIAESYGIPMVAAQRVATAADVEQAAASLGRPVAVKATVAGLTHKTDHGAVRLGLPSPAEAREAAETMGATLTAAGHPPEGFVVQEMVAGGIELLIGAMNHPSFGPIVLCGAGGVTAEVWGDVQTRLAPVGPRTAHEMVGGMRCSALLRGWRGAPALDIPGVEDVLVRMASLIADQPDIAEIECNPVLALPGRIVAVDLRVRLREGS